MNTRIITTEQELLAVKDDWDNLVQSNPETDMPFFSWDWFYHSWIHFGKPAGQELFVVVVYEGDKLIGILPLVLGTQKLRGIACRILCFCNSGMMPRNNAFYNPQYDRDTTFNVIMRRIFEQSKRWDMIRLGNIPETAAFHAFLLGKHDIPYTMIQTKGLISPYIELSGSMENYLKTLDKKVRYNIKRYVKLFESNPSKPVIRFFQKPEEITQALSAGLEVRRNSWKGLSDNTRFFAFWNAILPELCKKKEALLLAVFLNDRPIGVCYRLCRKGIYYGFGTDYHRDYKKDSPGTLMFYYFLQYITENGGTGFDFCGGDYDYKTQYTSLVHAHSTFQIFHTGWKSRLIYWVKTVLLLFCRKMFHKGASQCY